MAPDILLTDFTNMQLGMRQVMSTIQRKEMMHITPFWNVHNIVLNS